MPLILNHVEKRVSFIQYLTDLPAYTYASLPKGTAGAARWMLLNHETFFGLAEDWITKITDYTKAAAAMLNAGHASKRLYEGLTNEFNQICAHQKEILEKDPTRFNPGAVEFQLGLPYTRLAAINPVYLDTEFVLSELDDQVLKTTIKSAEDANTLAADLSITLTNQYAGTKCGHYRVDQATRIFGKVITDATVNLKVFQLLAYGAHTGSGSRLYAAHYPNGSSGNVTCG